MKLTLLDMVQDILNDMDSDPVNNVYDTPESEQVAQIIKTTYYDFIQSFPLPPDFLRELGTLNNVSDTSRPTHMRMDENVMEIKWIQYDVRELLADDPEYKEICYLYPDEFLKRISHRRASDAETQAVVLESGTTIYVKNNQEPKYWTSFDDDYIVFDAWFGSKLDTMIEGESRILQWRIPEWTFEDEEAFYPPLPVDAYPAFLAECKSVAMYKLLQQVDQKAEMQARKGHFKMSQRMWKAKGGIRYGNYGRRGKKHSTGSYRGTPRW